MAHSDAWGNYWYRTSNRWITPYEFKKRFEPLGLSDLYKLVYTESVASTIPPGNRLLSVIL